MATVHFYEKPGCLNNTRQKQLLIQAGHLLIVYDLMQQPWAENRAKLRSFFADMPVAQWFNRSAPAIKSGLLVPEMLDELSAIERMIEDPLLIRRPLLEVDGRRLAGFDAERILNWLAVNLADNDLETCTKTLVQKGCAP